MKEIRSDEAAASSHAGETAVTAEAVILSVRFASGRSNLTATRSAAKACSTLGTGMGEAVEAVRSTGRGSDATHVTLAHADTQAAGAIE